MTHSNPRRVLGVAAAMALAASVVAWGAQGTGKPAAGAAAGTATGQFTVNGKTATLKSATAKATADTFDASKTGYTLVLSDVPGLPGPYGSTDKVSAGTLHYIELTLGHDKSVYGAMLYHHGFKNDQMSKSGGIKLEVQTFGPDVLAGKVYMAEPGDFDGTRYNFTATFKAPITKAK
jgi:hypothetical protein